MKKGVFLFLILFVSYASANDVVLYNNWIKTGEPFSVGNDTFLVNYILESNATLIRFPEGISAAIYAGNMNCTQEWLYTVCQKGQKFQIAGKDVPPDVRSNSLDVSVFLTINKTEAGLAIKKEGMPSLFFIGDSATIKLRLEKIGSPIVYNISYSEAFPGFYVESLSSMCGAAKGGLTFYADIMSDAVTCVYRLTPNFEMVSNSTETVSYVVLEKPTTKTKSSKIEVLNSPVTVDIRYNKSQPIQSELAFILKISNNVLASPKEVFVFFPGPFAKKSSSPEFTVIENSLRLQNPKNADYIFTLQNNISGNYSLNVSINYEYNGLMQQTRQTFPIEITKKMFAISVFKQENGSLIRLSNTEPLAFKNIRLFSGGTVLWLPVLEKNRYKEFFIPFYDNKTGLGVSYQTEFGELFNETLFVTYTTYTLPPQTKIEDDKKELKGGFGFEDLKIDLPKEAIWIGLVVFAVFLLFIFIKSRPEKSELDKEIEELKEEERNEPIKNNRFK